MKNNFVIFKGNNSELIRTHMEQINDYQEFTIKNRNCLKLAFINCKFIWQTYTFSSINYQELDYLVKMRQVDSNNIILNQFECIHKLTTKNGIYRSLTTYYSQLKDLRNRKNFVNNILPTTYVLKGGHDFNDLDENYNKFKNKFKSLKKSQFQCETIPEKHLMNNIWILKPVSMNQGRGIELFSDMKQIQNYIGEKQQNNLSVAQKYIEKPLLYDNRKFDIRLWGLIHDNTLYLYEQGYMRTSSYSYQNDIQNVNVHLTNNCLQQLDKNYSQHEKGNTLSFQKLAVFLKQCYHNIQKERNVEFSQQFDFYEHFYQKFINIAVDCFVSVKDGINPNKRQNAFQLIGFDFLIDEDLRVWLIEVNDHPYLGVPNQFIKELLDRMVANMLQIVVKNQYDKDNNGFKVVYSNDVNLRQTISYSNLYPFEELMPESNKNYDKKEIVKTKQTETKESVQPKKKGIQKQISSIRKRMPGMIDMNQLNTIINKIYQQLEKKVEIEENIKYMNQLLSEKQFTFLFDFNFFKKLVHVIDNNDDENQNIQLFELIKQTQNLNIPRINYINAQIYSLIVRKLDTYFWKDKNTANSYLEFIYKQIQNIDQYFYIPAENKVSIQIKEQIINSRLIVYVILDLQFKNKHHEYIANRFMINLGINQLVQVQQQVLEFEKENTQVDEVGSQFMKNMIKNQIEVKKISREKQSKLKKLNQKQDELKVNQIQKEKSLKRIIAEQNIQKKIQQQNFNIKQIKGSESSRQQLYEKQSQININSKKSYERIKFHQTIFHQQKVERSQTRSKKKEQINHSFKKSNLQKDIERAEIYMKKSQEQVSDENTKSANQCFSAKQQSESNTVRKE